MERDPLNPRGQQFLSEVNKWLHINVFLLLSKNTLLFFCWPWVSLELPETVCSCSEFASFPTWIPPLSAGGGFQVGVCFIVSRRDPFLCWKTSPRQCFTEQKILWGTNYHISGSHGLGWYCVPGCTLTSFTALYPVYSTFSSGGFVNCFSCWYFDRW